MRSLLPLLNEDYEFLQAYIIGNEEREIDQRCTNISGYRPELIQDVQMILNIYIQLIHIFKTALDRMISDGIITSTTQRGLDISASIFHRKCRKRN